MSATTPQQNSPAELALATKYAPATATAAAVLLRLQDTTINSKEDYAAGAAQLVTLKGHINELDAERKALVQPLQEHMRKLQSIVDKPITLLKQAETLMKRALLDFDRRSEELAFNAMAEAAKLARSGDDSQALVKLSDAENAVRPDIKGVSYQDTLNIEIVDLSKVPVQYLELNRSAVMRDVRAGTKEITGLKLVPGRILKVRGAK